MKRIVFVGLVCFISGAAISQSSVVTLLSGGIEISAEDHAVLKDTLIDPEVWLTKALEGKIANCHHRFTNRWMPVLRADSSVGAVPVQPAAFISYVLAYSGYLNRAQRDSVEASR